MDQEWKDFARDMRESNAMQVKQNTEILIAMGRADERAINTRSIVEEHHDTLYSTKPPGLVYEVRRVASFVDSHQLFQRMFIGSVIATAIASIATLAMAVIRFTK